MVRRPCSQLVFECAGDDELGEEILQEEEHEHGDVKMVVWCPRLNMYPLLRLRWWTDPLLHLRRQIKIEEKLLLRGRYHQGQNLPGEYKWITQLQGSSAT
jgi:hypothetical protein